MPESNLQAILSCPNLPSLPAVAAQLIELASDPDVAISDIAKLVQQDQALAAKVIKTVNSSFYGLSTPCSSIDRAMGYLGLNTVKSLVLGFSLVETTKASGDGFDLEAHWRRAIIGATGSRAVAKIVGGIDADEAFTAALFQDMGMLALFAAMKSQYIETIEGIPHRIVSGLESDAFGYDHATVGTELAMKWKLPEEICEAIRYHHSPEKVAIKHQALGRVVSIGAMLSDAMEEDAGGAAISKIQRLSRSWYAERAPEIGTLLEEVRDASQTLAKMFDQEIGDIPDSAMLLERAQEKELEHQLRVQRQVDVLEREAHIDGLTMLANRKQFDLHLVQAFDGCMSKGIGFGVLFFDADRFKRVNDTHGHAAGDAVLVELARRTSEAVGDAGVVFRYGGEEFTVIVSDTTIDECARLGERIRSRISGSPFDLSGVDGAPNELGVSVSVGVSSSDAGAKSRLKNAAQIVHEADECVYAAKADGRNNVKVWGRLDNTSPRVEKTSRATPVRVHKGVGSVGRILLVEDDSLAATMVISLIKRRSKVDVQWVKSGTKACILLESGKFVGDQALSLILCDFSLPGCDGHEVLRVAKRTPGIAELPFVMLTGSTDDDMKSESHRLGATLFIRKDEFCADVNKWLDELIRSSAVAA